VERPALGRDLLETEHAVPVEPRRNRRLVH
jgi:hypothetical protein